ncbi:MAG: M48 family metalloprotease, partial [Bdellovibrionales bacterium]|nr:M48 family metalloprotease [Bdellovibrionales bacterium]
GDSAPSPMLHWVLTMVFEIVLGLIGAMIVAWFSRQREYRADAGGARYAGRENMIRALQALQRTTQLVDSSHSSLATLKISGRPGGFLALFASHPPLEERIQRLAAGR